MTWVFWQKVKVEWSIVHLPPGLSQLVRQAAGRSSLSLPYFPSHWLGLVQAWRRAVSAAHSVVTTRTLVHPGRTEAHFPDPGAQLGALRTHTGHCQTPGHRDNFHYLLTFIHTQQVKVKWILLATLTNTGARTVSVGIKAVFKLKATQNELRKLILMGYRQLLSFSLFCLFLFQILKSEIICLTKYSITLLKSIYYSKRFKAIPSSNRRWKEMNLCRKWQGTIK